MLQRLPKRPTKGLSFHMVWLFTLVPGHTRWNSGLEGCGQGRHSVTPQAAPTEQQQDDLVTPPPPFNQRLRLLESPDLKLQPK